MKKVKSLLDNSCSDVVWSPDHKKFEIKGLTSLDDLEFGDMYETDLYKFEDIVSGKSKRVRVGDVNVRADGSVAVVFDGTDNYDIPFRIRADLDTAKCKHLEIVTLGRGGKPVGKYVIDHDRFNTVIKEFTEPDSLVVRKTSTLKVSDPYNMVIETFVS